MNLLSAIRTACRALMINKGRSILTSLGIVIGIGAVVALTAAGGGARHKLDERLQSVGKNLILVRSGARTDSGAVADFAPLSVDDHKAIMREAGALLDGAAPTQATPRLLSAHSHTWQTVLIGTTKELRRVGAWNVRYGRFFDDEDAAKDALVCVLGRTVSRKLFPELESPVGRFVQANRVQLRVIGVLDPKGRNPIGVDQDDQVFLPITTLQHRVAGKDNVAMILASARSEGLIERAKREVARTLRQQHHLRPGAPDDFDVSSVQEMAAIGKVLAATMQGLVAVIASVSLLVGGVGIMNIMLTSVTERTREIGIRMAIGATPDDVLAQFLIEALVLALGGGLLGITAGIAGAVALAALAGWPVVVSPGMVALAFFVSAAVGVFFGYYPAWKASRLDPIRALQRE
jgi:putative ABC transport system permease protein